MTNSQINQQRKLLHLIEHDSLDKSRHASVVHIRADYENNPERCLTSVVFIPPEISDMLTQLVIQRLAKIEPEHHYYSPVSMHMTIKNIRKLAYPPTYNESDIRKADLVLSERIPQHAAFKVSFEEVVAFSTSVSLVGYSHYDFGSLIQTLNTGLREVHLEDDKQYISNSVFFMNVTICRFVHTPSHLFLSLLRKIRYDLVASLMVRKVCLIESNPVCSLSTLRHINTYHLADD